MSYKFHLFYPGDYPPKWWIDFTHNNKQHFDATLATYNAKFICRNKGRELAERYLEFETEGDATMFLLKVME